MGLSKLTSIAVMAALPGLEMAEGDDLTKSVKV